MIGGRRNWTEEEDKKLHKLVKKFKKLGTRKWASISEEMNENSNQIRTNDQCKKRWENYLDPKINKNKWGRDQIKLVFQKHAEMGNRWINIVEYLKDRTTADVKNQFHCALRRGLRRMYKLIDPRERMTNKIKAIKPNDLSNLLVNLEDNKKQCYQMLFQFSGENYKNFSLGANTDKIINFLMGKFDEKFQSSSTKNETSNSSLMSYDQESFQQKQITGHKYLRSSETLRSISLGQNAEGEELKLNSINPDFFFISEPSQNGKKTQCAPSNLNSMNQSRCISFPCLEISVQDLKNKNKESSEMGILDEERGGKSSENKPSFHENEERSAICPGYNSMVFQQHDEVLGNNFREFFRMEDSGVEFNCEPFQILE